MTNTIPFLGQLLVGLGVLGVVAGMAMLRFPAACRRGLAAFPRSRLPGWVLTGIGVFWVAWMVYHAALGRFEGLKPAMPVAAILLFGAMIYFLDELLAPRALGGLLLLLANPMLLGVRWVESAWRLVPVLIAYAWVVAGCALMLHPWLFRKACERWLGSDVAVVRWGGVKLLGGAVLLGAGLTLLR